MTRIERYLVKHPNLLGHLLKIRMGVLHDRLIEILEKQRKRGLVLVKNVSGRTIKRDVIVAIK